MPWPKLAPFEIDSEFPSCLSEAVEEVLQSLRQGYLAHGDAFAEQGLPGFAVHCLRKARDKKNVIVDGMDIGEEPNRISLELTTYALLERAYWTMLRRRGLCR